MNFDNPCAGWKSNGSHWHEADEGAKDRLCLECRASMIEKNKALPTSWQRYAIKYGDNFRDFYHNTTQLSLCGNRPYFLVQLTMDDEGSHYGWRESHHPHNYRPGSINFIYNRRMAVSICFPYGVENEIATGCGQVVRLNIELIREAVGTEGLPVGIL